MDSLARVLGALLPHGRQWQVVGDVSLFDDLLWGEGWMWDDEAEPDGMQISPLSINGNTVRVRVRGGWSPGDPVLTQLDPETGFVPVANRAVTAADTAGGPLQISRKPGDPTNTVYITGAIWPGQTSSAHLSVRDPARYALTLFSEQLAARGIRCTDVRIDSLSPSARPMCAFTRTLDTVVTEMNRVSDNLSAECLLKTLGAARFGKPGTAATGIQAIREYLGANGIDTARVILADGSGVSRYNLVTARGIAGLLGVMYRNAPLFPTFLSSLAGPGERGSLSGRLRGTSAERNLRAKTGTLRGASAFSGYVTTAAGEPLAFAILMQNFGGNLRSYRQVQDRIGVLLSSWGK